MNKSGWALFSLLTLLAGHARADWEGDMESKLKGADGPAMKGKIRMKKGFTRMDMTAPMPVSTIIDMDKRKGWALLHEQKLVMVSDINKADQQIPMCKSNDVDKCLQEKGFKKAGSDNFDGHLCTIYEHESGEGDAKSHVRIWRPIDLKEVPSVKTVAEDGGKIIETTIRNIKTVAQDAKYFTVPKDYRNMGDMNEMMRRVKAGDLPGLKKK